MNPKKLWLFVLLASILFITLMWNSNTGFQSPVKADDAPLAQATNPLPTISPSPQPTSPLPTPIGYTPRPPMGPTLWMTPPVPVTATPLPDATATALPVAMGLPNEYSAASLSQASLIQSKWFLPLAHYRKSMTYDKKGIGDDWQTWKPVPPNPAPGPGTNLNALNFTWFYDWSFYYLPSRNTDVRYARMIWCNGLWQQDINNNWRYVGDVARADYNSGFAGRIWLVFNETDAPGQCNLPDPLVAADFYVTAYDIIKANDPTAGVFAGGMVYLNTVETRNWWTTFVNRLSTTGNLYKLQGVHVHLYPKISTSPTRNFLDCNSAYCVPELAQTANRWYQEMHVNLGLGDRPLWISETGWLGENSCTSTRFTQIRDNFMIPWSKWFAKDSSWPYSSQAGVNPGYAAVAWYVSRDVSPSSTACTYLLNALGPAGAPTSLGTFWNGYQP